MGIIVHPDSMTGRVITLVREQFAELNQAKIESADSTLDLTADEWFNFQQLQSNAFAMKQIGLEDAQTLHAALGDNYNGHNGGWANDVDTATKYGLTLVFTRLLEVKVGMRRAS